MKALISQQASGCKHVSAGKQSRADLKKLRIRKIELLLSFGHAQSDACNAQTSLNVQACVSAMQQMIVQIST